MLLSRLVIRRARASPGVNRALLCTVAPAQERSSLVCIAYKGEEERSRRILLKSAVLISAAALLRGDTFAEAKSEDGGDKEAKDKSEPRLSIEETRKVLKGALDLTREEVSRKYGIMPPKVKLSTGDTHSAWFVLPSGSDFVRLLASLMEELGGSLEGHSSNKNPDGAMVCFTFKGGSGSVMLKNEGGGPSIHFYREGGFSASDLSCILTAFKSVWSFEGPSRGRPGSNLRAYLPDGFGKEIGGLPGGYGEMFGFGDGDDWTFGSQKSKTSDPVARLRKLGVEVFDKNKVSAEPLSWDDLAGYSDVKQEVEDTVVQALKHPEEYNEIAKKTRVRFETNRPKAILLEGPPGTGKTLTARIIAWQTNKPMVHVNIESIVTKWFGESERNMGQIFDACDEMGGAIIFLDEVDALATSRGSQMHEASRRILSVILRRIEGFEGNTKSTLICATNRRSDLDAALLSRFDLGIKFELPNETARCAILGRYAKQLDENSLQLLAQQTDRMSCRDLKDICEQAERRWAAKLIRGEKDIGAAPDQDAYLASVAQRRGEGDSTTHVC